ncbi:MAG: hypothetical protein IJW01_01525 [Paludibacteraceae bacterium]|nr:hypothetical protein [Paludibacteraceae bacterium]
MDKIALLIIYNHRYDKNIEPLEQIYAGRFSYIYHIVPFYDGQKENVIPVYESSFYFEGYIAQCFQHLKDKGFTHYFFVADDLMLNPLITEQNLFEISGMKREQPFISELFSLKNKQYPWYHLIDALEYNPKKLGVEIADIIPSCNEVRSRIEYYNLNADVQIPLWMLIKLFWHRKTKRSFLFVLKSLLSFRWVQTMKYPLIGAYSDILLVPQSMMNRFVGYCGAFAASDLFVELAIPTALIMCSEQVVTEKDLLLNKSLHSSKDDFSILDKYQFNYNALESDFPENHLFLHPIKLSKWKK